MLHGEDESKAISEILLLNRDNPESDGWPNLQCQRLEGSWQSCET